MELCNAGSTEAGSIGSVLGRCCTMVSSKEETAAAAEAAATTRRKAVPSFSRGNKAATSPPAAAGAVPGGEKPAAGVTAAAAADDGAGGERGNLTRMSQQHVDYILAWKPRPIQDPDEYYNRMINHPLQLFTQEYIEHSTEVMRNIAEVSKRNNEKFKEFQDWARAEFEMKGYVEVDDIYIARRVLLQQVVTQEDWNAAMARARKAEALQLNDGICNSLEKQGEKGVALESN